MATASFTRVSVAANPWTRLRGLMGRRTLDEGEGLLLRGSGSVHTCFMRFPIDVVFLDRDMTVIGIAPAVRPWRAAARRGAKAVLELAAGEAERRGLEVGDGVRVDSATDDVHREGERR
jgi:uncharacterized membrane protein (UPF0127 family)